MSFWTCPQCQTGNAAGMPLCGKCKFPRGADPNDWAECWSCQDWYLICDLTEKEPGWYCQGCLLATADATVEADNEKYAAAEMKAEGKDD
ncbi:MAG: hypothetical protein M0R06_25095 [Sphaerochaeta sp.]|nr:hypothetical protein [Sphaerochaeta sp.]